MWGEVELWNFSWTLDAFAHFKFGLVSGFILLYWIKTNCSDVLIYSPKWMVAFIIVSIVTAIFEVLIWEILIEWLAWDAWLQPNYFPWRAKAQKGSTDTNLDILVTLLGATTSMIFWWLYRIYFEWRWPNAAVEEKIEEAAERRAATTEEITQMKKEHQKKVRARLKQKIKIKLMRFKK